MRRSITTAYHSRAPLAIFSIVVASWTSPMLAANCEGLVAPRQEICQAALVDIQKLQDQWPQDPPCSVTRTRIRLLALVTALDSGGPYVPEDFQTRTVSALSDGIDYQRGVVFFGTDEAVELWLEDGYPSELLPAGACVAAGKELVVVSGITEHIYELAVAANAQPLVEGAKNLVRLHETWLWVITDGFGQFPWERGFNDLVHREPPSIYKLPKVEWVLAHPSVAIEFTDPEGASSKTRVKPAILVEPFGFVRYRFDLEKGKRHYIGASLLAVLGEDIDPGYGALFRFDAFSAGIVRHSVPGSAGGGHEWGVTATIELLERLQSARKKLFEASKRPD